MIIKTRLKMILDYIYKHRYIIGLIIFILCILFKISGSSIECWKDIMNFDDKSIVFGKSRSVRSDEWATLTPMFFAQVENGFHYFNTALRATKTDVFMVYALPVITIFQFFRPFLLGFIILGAERGLSFFWCGRFIALFLVSIDFFMIITKKNKPLSFIGALMITLAPIVQWWFAVNGIAEIFIFGELISIMVFKYLNTDSFKKRLLYLFITYLSAGGYALVFYPSWQIPMAFVFAAIVIAIIIDNYKKGSIKLKDIISIIITIIVLGISLLLIIYKSMDTIKIITNTDYPGKRFELGGGQLNYILSYIISLFLPLKHSGLISNAPEESLFFSLFPIGLILSIREIIKKGKKDKLLVTLLIVYIFLFIWCVNGFPRILAKITLLSNSQSHRSLLALGFIDILLLIRSLSINNKPINKYLSILYTVFLTGIIILNNMNFQKNYLNKYMIICLIIMCLYMFYTVFRYHTKYGKYLFALGIIFVMLVSGGLVNPIRIGTSSIIDNKIIKEIKKINKKEQGIWITEGLGYPVGNFIGMSGAKTINVTNTYPDLDKWYKIDKEKKYKSIYNRYSHIQMDLVKEEKENKFELLNPDYFIVYVNNDDLDTLKVNYVFSRNKLEEYNDDKHTYKNIYEYKGYKIYSIIREK